MAEVTLRPASAADEDLLLAWANDPTTRAASFHPATIDPAEHRAWLAHRLASPTTRLLIGLVDEQPVGQVRVDVVAEGTAEISISIAADRRGRQLGGQLLAAAIEAGRSDPDLAIGRFLARIRLENEVSIRLFERAGFRLRERTLEAGVPSAVLELEASRP